MSEITNHQKNPKLIEILDHELLQKLLSAIDNDTKVTLSVVPKVRYTISHNEKDIFMFEVSKCGNQKHNAISVIRDLLNEGTTKTWTRKVVEQKIIFE